MSWLSWLKFCFWLMIFGVLLPSLFFLWMQKKGWVKPSGSLSMEFRDTADGSLVYSWRNGSPLQFEVPVQKVQTLSFQNQAYRFTGSICFRSGTQPPAAPKETAYP